MFVVDYCDEYKFFGAYFSESDAETAIDIAVMDECLRCDCTPSHEEYEELYEYFRKCFKIVTN